LGGENAFNEGERESMTLTARSYVRADANWNVTSLVRANAAVSPVFTTVERYECDPYGSVTYLSGSFGVLTASAYGQRYLHQGGRLDEVTGLYFFNSSGKGRNYDPQLGRWVQVDRLHSYIIGDSRFHSITIHLLGKGGSDGNLMAQLSNLYAYCQGSPTANRDPSGLVTAKECWEKWIGLPGQAITTEIYKAYIKCAGKLGNNPKPNEMLQCVLDELGGAAATAVRKFLCCSRQEFPLNIEEQQGGVSGCIGRCKWEFCQASVDVVLEGNPADPRKIGLKAELEACLANCDASALPGACSNGNRDQSVSKFSVGGNKWRAKFSASCVSCG